jgi:hypothetical protein
LSSIVLKKIIQSEMHKFYSFFLFKNINFMSFGKKLSDVCQFDLCIKFVKAYNKKLENVVHHKLFPTVHLSVNEWIGMSSPLKKCKSINSVRAKIARVAK